MSVEKLIEETKMSNAILSGLVEVSEVYDGPEYYGDDAFYTWDTRSSDQDTVEYVDGAYDQN